jgi:hypothetical protein
MDAKRKRARSYKPLEISLMERFEQKAGWLARFETPPFG